MRLYIIGFMVGALGLVVANQVRAEARRDPGRDSTPTASLGSAPASALAFTADTGGPGRLVH